MPVAINTSDPEEAKLIAFISDTTDEVKRAEKLHPPLNSLHEAYAVILEELDELWEQVRKKRMERNREEIYIELVQIAAMAARAAMNLNYYPRWLEEAFRKQREQPRNELPLGSVL